MAKLITESGFVVEPRKTKTGFLIYPCYYKQHPKRHSDWVKEARRGYTPDGWAREMEIDFHKTPEKRVYKEFDSNVHCKELVYNPHLTVLRGWDFGYTEACVFAQWDSNKKQLYVIGEVVDIDSYIHTFKQKVIDYCSENFPGAFYQDFCDISGTFKSEKAEKTDVEVLCDANVGGVSIYPMSRKADINRGLTAIRDLLAFRKNETVGLLIDPRKCPILVRGFQGEYVLDKKDKPKADQHPIDDPQDGLRYIVENHTGVTWRYNAEMTEDDEDVAETSWPTSSITGYRR